MFLELADSAALYAGCLWSVRVSLWALLLNAVTYKLQFFSVQMYLYKVCDF